jgi:hypothetical protein
VLKRNNGTGAIQFARKLLNERELVDVGVPQKLATLRSLEGSTRCLKTGVVNQTPFASEIDMRKVSGVCTWIAGR